MGQSFLDKIQAKLELFRLEKRYTRRRHRRSTFVSNAVYVDGEYVYQTPNSTGSSTGSSNVDALHGGKPSVSTSTTPEPTPSATFPTTQSNAERKRLNRFSSMPGFGNGINSKESSRVEDRRASMIR